MYSQPDSVWLHICVGQEQAHCYLCSHTFDGGGQGEFSLILTQVIGFLEMKALALPTFKLLGAKPLITSVKTQEVFSLHGG